MTLDQRLDEVLFGDVESAVAEDRRCMAAVFAFSKGLDVGETLRRFDVIGLERDEQQRHARYVRWVNRVREKRP